MARENRCYRRQKVDWPFCKLYTNLKRKMFCNYGASDGCPVFKILSWQFILCQLLNNGMQLIPGSHRFCWEDRCQLIVAYLKVIFLYSLAAFKIFLFVFCFQQLNSDYLNCKFWYFSCLGFISLLESTDWCLLLISFRKF